MADVLTAGFRQDAFNLGGRSNIGEHNDHRMIWLQGFSHIFQLIIGEARVNLLGDDATDDTANDGSYHTDSA